MSRTTVTLSDSLEINSGSALCRICMKNNDSYYNVFTSNVACEMAVKDVLHDLVGLQVAMGDGLPTTICPLCLKKLMEFHDFKRICFESDAELRKLSSRNYIEIKEEKAADDNAESSADTKECVQDAIEGTSQFACSVQRTEIYIPVQDCQLPRANIMFNVKEENGELLNEENYPAFNSPNTAGISNDAVDPLLVDDESMSTKDEKLIDNSKMTNDSMTEATGLSTSGKTLLEKALTSCMLKERNTWVGLSSDCIAPSVSVTNTQSKTVASHAGEGGNVIDEELEEDSALHADKTRSNSIPDDGQSNIEHSPDYFCSACNRSFAHKGSLKCHMQRKHGVIESHSCRICGETFTKISYLNEHMHSHKGVKRFACNECTMSFSKKSLLNLHMRTHTGEKPYSCKLCSRNFAHSSNLKGHMLVHSDVRPFPCNECAKAFYTKRDLMVHLRTHTAEKPFECSLCGKCFSAKNTLVLHLRTHTGEKPYSCDKCNKRFSGNSILKKHMRTHTKEFVCNHCGESFSRKDRYFVHMCSHTEETI